MVVWNFLTGDISKVFTNIPAYKVLTFDDDEIVIVHTEGVIEKIGKSLSCSIDDVSMVFTNCSCDELSDKAMYLNLSSASLPTCDVV